MTNIIKAKKIEVLDNLEINIIFQDGDKRILDVKPYCTGKAFKDFLNNEILFKTAHLDELGGIEWDNGVSLSSETIYLKSE